MRIVRRLRQAIGVAQAMADPVVQNYCNDAGADSIRIGVREFKCMGASPPFDHPHVYLDMGSDGQIICPYCSTLYIYDGKMGTFGTDPVGCIHEAAD